MSTDGIEGGKNMQVTYDEIIEALMQDESWEVPPEEREMFRYGMEWFFISF